VKRLVTIQAFAASAITVLALQVVARYGYTSAEGIIILLLIAAVTALLLGPGLALGIAIAVLLTYVLRHFIDDPLVAAGVLAVIVLIVVLVAERPTGRFWKTW
jgi:hypothetical protein